MAEVVATHELIWTTLSSEQTRIRKGMAPKRSRLEYEADLRGREAPFVIYGTPLPPLDDNTRDHGTYVPAWKQEVLDEKGRKRLHGAFTGGFSAG